MTAPIPVRVTRYQDPHCGRTHSSRRRAEAHMARCWRNPDARGCLTCRHHVDPWQTDGGDFCEQGVDLTGRPECDQCIGGTVGDIFDEDGPDPCPKCGGNNQAVRPGPIVHCEKWEARNADR